LAIKEVVVSEDYIADQEAEQKWDESMDVVDEGDASSEEYEEISSDEVDRIVATLEALMDSTKSENIKGHLEEALNNVYYLVYDQDDDADDEADDEVDEGDGDVLCEAA
jgi:hypothetical protein